MMLKFSMAKTVHKGLRSFLSRKHRCSIKLNKIWTKERHDFPWFSLNVEQIKSKKKGLAPHNWDRKVSKYYINNFQL